MNRAPALVLFDLDGVLVDTSACHAAAFAELWRRCGVDGPDYARIAGRPTHEVVAEVTARVAPSAETLRGWVRFKQERARAEIASAAVVFPDVAPCLAALRARGVRVAIATGASRETAALLVARLGLADGLASFVTAEDVTEGKPSPAAFNEAMRRAGARPAETLVVEDSASGLEAAIASGARVACVRSGLSIAHPSFAGSFTDVRECLVAVGVVDA